MATSNWAKAIIHLDMDAFYAAVEVMDNPDLQGKPVIVGGSKERGVVSSASYEARTFGIHSAQPVATAMKLCPQGIFRPVRMWRYKEISRQIFTIFRRFSPLVEPLSLDEDYRSGRFELPDTREILLELREMFQHTYLKSGLFMANHASNYLPIKARMPKDREKILELIDAALRGEVDLKPEWMRGF